MSSAPVLSKRLDGVSESATLKLNAAVQAMKARGIDIVNLTAGEPDFGVHEAAKKAVIEALAADRSKYTPVAGIPELRQAVADKTNAQQPSLAKTSPWKATDVIVTNGGKQAIFDALFALLNTGDEVLIPAPYWLSYPEMTKLCGGTPKIIEAPFSQGYKITPAQLQAAITPKSKVLILNSPSNPTGAMYTQAELAALGDVLLKTPGAEKIWVISDEIYDQVILDKIPFCSFLEAVPKLRDRTVTVNGMSKSAAMTGWRIGWSVAPARLTSAMSTLQGQSTSGINALAQWASLAALKLPPSEFESQLSAYKKRRDLCLEILRKAPKMEVFPPAGAFYFFVGISAYLRKGEDSIGFAERLLEGAQVATVPGTPFGEPSCLRLSFSTDEKSLREGCERLVKFLASS